MGEFKSSSCRRSNLWEIMSQLRWFGANIEEFKLDSHGKHILKCFRVSLSEFKWLTEDVNDSMSVC